MIFLAAQQTATAEKNISFNYNINSFSVPAQPYQIMPNVPLKSRETVSQKKTTRIKVAQ
jgi:hypothetical protein